MWVDDMRAVPVLPRRVAARSSIRKNGVAREEVRPWDAGMEGASRRLRPHPINAMSIRTVQLREECRGRAIHRIAGPVRSDKAIGNR
jgi:hypothetical protein